MKALLNPLRLAGALCAPLSAGAQPHLAPQGNAFAVLGMKADDVQMDQGCRATHPEWSDVQRDSARAVWQQWWRTGPPRDAEALAFLWPTQQFALERYQAQFGWPRDSTEWRALPLSGAERELLQRLYHGPRQRFSASRHDGNRWEPAWTAGWSCSNCAQGSWSAHRLGSGTRLALVGPTSNLSLLPWLLRSPSDRPIRLWLGPESFAAAFQPGKLPGGAPPWLTGIERFSVGRHPTSGILGEVAVRRAAWAAAASLSQYGWWFASGTWYGPGGVLLQVQQERRSEPRQPWAHAAADSLWVRPAAGATPWRAQRGNRATAALPLWAGRLSLTHGATGQSASWADRSSSVSWSPRQLALGRYVDVTAPDRRLVSSVRVMLYAGRAQGASLHLRAASPQWQGELGLAGITAPDAVLPRALGPISLWRPGCTGEAGLSWIRGPNLASIRLRYAPSGWSGSLRVNGSLDSRAKAKPVR